MKNVTVSLDDETYRRGRVYAAENGTTLSAMVREFLTEFGRKETKEEAAKRQLREMFERIDRLALERGGKGFSASDRLSRDELYDRTRARREAAAEAEASQIRD